MWEVSRLRQHWRVILLFLLMVLLPALIFTVLIIREVRGEQMQATHQKAERQRQIVRLVEADLNAWLFTSEPQSAISKALFRFQLQRDQIAFPEFHLSLPSVQSPRRFPFKPAVPTAQPSAQVITDSYYPRILTFLRDLKSGAQYFLRLRVLVVRPPGRDYGYVLEDRRVLEHVNRRLAELGGVVNLKGTLFIAGLDDTRSSPATAAFGLEGFPFFQVVFGDSETATLTNVRRHAFAYVMALLLLVTVLASVLLNRAVAHEARLSQLRTDFVAAVSHDFRSPLSSILALSERLETARIRDPEKLAQYHEIIGEEARRLSALVTRLLDFAQIEEGKRVYSLQRVELIAIAREAIQSCHRSVRQDRIRFCGEEAAPLWVRADRTALHHCIQNLIENAVKYSPPDSPIAVTCAPADGSGVVEVLDHGIGIPRAEQGRIFEKFYRGSQASALGVQGVGIGLALVKHVMESHGGSVSVESEPGQGSRFRLRLPRAEV
ncbi:MAG: HAMP domain-containing histidine kinase [Acidobacteria bacterium]|nr:HAMP domain-containing histidine kinase [Acidobacteriota bacterium]